MRHPISLERFIAHKSPIVIVRADPDKHRRGRDSRATYVANRRPACSVKGGNGFRWIAVMR